MSAPMQLDSGQLRRLANALDALTQAAEDHAVSFVPYGTLQIEVDGVTVEVGTDADDIYRVDDRVGS